MADTYPYLEVGDPVTLDLLNGASGINGEVVAVDLNDDGTLRCLSIRDDPARPDLLRIHGGSIAIWRCGQPVRRAVPQGLAVPAGMPPGLLNGGRQG
jgi:hypothetical protein